VAAKTEKERQAIQVERLRSNRSKKKTQQDGACVSPVSFEWLLWRRDGAGHPILLPHAW
jgi:hypothetical protein